MPWTPGDDYIYIKFLHQSIITIILHVSLVELKSGRIPEGVTKRLGYWKAEEFRKFTYPASECILGGILPNRTTGTLPVPEPCREHNNAMQKLILNYIYASASARTHPLNSCPRAL